MRKNRAFVVCLLVLSVAFAWAAENPGIDAMQDLVRLKQRSNPSRLEALQKILEERGIPYELQPFDSKASPHGRRNGTNVIMTFGKGNSEITLGAHYDAVEWNQGGIADGMIDNGAATIILVHVAEALKSRTLRHRVRVVLFDMEEMGLLGSQAYVAAHKSDTVAAINLDIAGSGDALGYGYARIPGTDRIRKALMMTCAEQLLTCMDFADFPASDDRSFQNANIPVISVGLGPQLAMHQAWLLLDGGENSGLQNGFIPPFLKIIHTPEDNLSQIDPASLNLGFQVMLRTVLKLDASLE